MAKHGNWLPWLRPASKAYSAGTSLVELLVALAMAILLFSLLVTTLRVGLKTYRTSVEHSEALQNAWIALNWLKKDLQATRALSLSLNQRQVTLELPRQDKDRTSLQWYKAKYLFQREKAQLLRDVSGSYNIVAEKIVDFTVTLDKEKPIAYVTVTSQNGTKQIELHSTVWLRNLR